MCIYPLVRRPPGLIPRVLNLKNHRNTYTSDPVLQVERRKGRKGLCEHFSGRCTKTRRNNNDSNETIDYRQTKTPCRSTSSEIFELVNFRRTRNTEHDLNNMFFCLRLKIFKNQFTRFRFPSLFCSFCRNVNSFINCSNSLKFAHVVRLIVAYEFNTTRPSIHLPNQ